MRRPIVFALELLASLALATAGAWLAAKAGRKMNAKANGDIRAAAAQERIAAALERAYPSLPTLGGTAVEPCKAAQSRRCGE